MNQFDIEDSDWQLFVDMMGAAGRSTPDFAAAQQLLESGVDANMQSRYGNPLLHSAASWAELEFVKLLVEHGADVNRQDSSGETALTCASCFGSTEIVDYLIQHGADVNLRRDDLQNSAIHFAAVNGHVDVVKLLISAGADVNAEYGSPIAPVSVLGTAYFCPDAGARQQLIEILKSMGAKRAVRRDSAFPKSWWQRILARFRRCSLKNVTP